MFSVHYVTDEVETRPGPRTGPSDEAETRPKPSVQCSLCHCQKSSVFQLRQEVLIKYVD